MTKEDIRLSMRLKRRALTSDEVKCAGRNICRQIFSLDFIKDAKTVMTFISSFKEPDTNGIFEELEKQKKKIVLPISNTENFTIIPSYIDNSSSLTEGAYGIKEPSVIKTAKPSDIDVAIIPGIAFTEKGDRLGFGKGYYDKFLSEFNGVKIGICYEFQLLDKLPTAEHDINMDIIVTEKRIYRDF